MQTVIYYHRPVHSYHLLKTVMDYRSSLVWNCSMTSQKYRVVCLSASIIRNQLDKIWLSGNISSFFIISFQIDRICTSEKKRAIALFATALHHNFESTGFKVTQSNILFITLAGLPKAIMFSGISFVTTEPAPITELSPMVTSVYFNLL